MEFNQFLEISHETEKTNSFSFQVNSIPLKLSFNTFKDGVHFHEKYS